MRRTAYLFAALVLGAALPIGAQKLPKGLEAGIDTFTGDTVYSTKYGRLDEPNGCGRSQLAIVWELARGKRGQAEFLVYKYMATRDPVGIHKLSHIGGHAMFLNVDGDIFEVKHTREAVRFGGDRTMKTEDAAFILPEGTLQRVAMAREVRLRIMGTDKTCDGIIEENMRLRLRALHNYLEGARP